METVLEALKGVNAYPVPLRTLTTIADKRGLSLTTDATQEVQKSKEYNLAVADLLLWLSTPPIYRREGSPIRSRTNSAGSSATGLTACTMISGQATRQEHRNLFTDIKALGYDYSKRNNRIQDKDSERD